MNNFIEGSKIAIQRNGNLMFMKLLSETATVKIEGRNAKETVLNLRFFSKNVNPISH